MVGVTRLVRNSVGSVIEVPGLASGAVQSLGYVQLTLNDAQAQSPNVPDDATFALVRVEVQAIRYRDDGTAPTKTVGMPVAVGEALIYDADMSEIAVIGQVAGAVVNITFYGPSNAG